MGIELVFNSHFCVFHFVLPGLWCSLPPFDGLTLQTLKTCVFPVFGKKTVDKIDSADVLLAIGPMWNELQDTAKGAVSTKTAFATMLHN
jgi:hypothetical protein